VSPGVAQVTFVVAESILIVTPGPDTALVLRTSAVEGSRREAYTSAVIRTGTPGLASCCWPN